MVKALNSESDSCDLFLALPWSSCMTSGKSLNPSVPQFPIYKLIFFFFFSIPCHSCLQGKRYLSADQLNVELYYIAVFECPRIWVMPLASSSFQMGREKACLLFQNLSKTCYGVLAVKTGSQTKRQFLGNKKIKFDLGPEILVCGLGYK